MDEKKIILSGLQNAGKSSIMLALNKKYKFEEIIKELAPTIRIEYNRWKYLGLPLNVWDMGGQENYRSVYERRKEFYFSETDVFFFVIDVQDAYKIPEAIDYLSIIIKFWFEENMQIPTILCLHKTDPDVRESPEIAENVAKIKKLVEKKLFFWRNNITYFNTSIYDVQSIVDAFSKGLRLVVHDYERLENLFREFGKRMHRVGMMLMDKAGVILCENYERDLQPTIVEEVFQKARESIVLLRKMEQEQAYMDLIADTSSEHEIEFQLHRIALDDANFFGIFLLRDEGILAFDEALPEFKTRVQEALSALRS